MSIPISKKPKIAIVHDFLTYFGGAERVLMSLHKTYPDAPIYTLLYDEKKMKKYFPEAKVKTSFLNKFPKFLRKRKKYLLPFMPTAAETFDLRDFDVVISSSSSFVKGIITKPKAVHISYCHTPTRFLWDWHYNYLAENKIKGIKKIFILPFLHYLRMWDKSAAERVDYFIANSEHTAKRIGKFYGRGSEVIYPPTELEVHKVHKVESQAVCHSRPVIRYGINSGGNPVEQADSNVNFNENRNDNEKSPQFPLRKGEQYDNYFLIVSRLSPYKKIDIAIEAFNKLELPLVIIGEGEDKKRLEKIANKNIEFLGFQSEERLAQYYKNCYAFIFPGEDDFGITPIEAMSFGKPVLAYRKGGVLETIAEGETGEFFDDPIPEILADGVRRMKNNYNKYNSEEIKKQAEKFSEERFREKMKDFVENTTELSS
ncbi:glycosyltransferase [Candidatus Parcubacteria bacterium]|nr:glycosyltransferase [Candidatus Parcubacteria bacterium]